MSIYLGRNKVSIKYNGSILPSPKEQYNQVCAKVKFCQDKLIEEGGRGSYSGAWICLRDDTMDYEEFNLDSSQVIAIQTSDGYTYEYSQGSTITHHWNNEKDFVIDGAGSEKYRWVIYYYGSSSINSNSTYLDCEKAYNQIYVFDMELKFYSITSGNTHNTYGLFRYNDVIQSFDFINDHKCTEANSNSFAYFGYYCYSLTKLPDALDVSLATNFTYFCYYCYSLEKLPDNIDTSNGTNFSQFCGYCYSLPDLPENIDTRKGTNFSNFCHYCYSLAYLPDNFNTSRCTNFSGFCSHCQTLTKLPDSFDTSKGTNFSNFCYYCFAMTKLPNVLDISKGTNFSSFCYCCYSLKRANIILPSGYSITTLNGSNYLTIESMKYISDHAPTVTTGGTLTIGSTNIARANKYGTTIISNLTAKGWTVN